MDFILMDRKCSQDIIHYKFSTSRVCDKDYSKLNSVFLCFKSSAIEEQAFRVHSIKLSLSKCKNKKKYSEILIVTATSKAITY